MAGGSFWTMLRLAGFLAAVWFGGKAAKYVKMSTIVFEILIGLLFAPGLLPLELLPPIYSNCGHELTDKAAGLGEWAGAHRLLGAASGHDDGSMAHYCTSEPNIFSFVGHIGVGLMIFESGMHFDFDGCKKVLPKATVVAIFGTFLPLLAGVGLTGAFGFPIYPDGFAAGVALAPTSVGIALKLLMEAKVLQKDFGQLILSAAFVDDILSLVIFNILFAITGPNGFDPITCVVFPVIGCVFMLTFGALGISFWPKILTQMKERLSPGKFNEAVMCLMFALLLGYGSFTMYLGTHLWGAFVAGMSFAGFHEAHHIWSHQTKRMTRWMMRIFFSCTVAFAIPYESLFKLDAFAYGSIMGIVACIATKVVSGICMGDAKFVIGWAMVGRAEFAYLIAEMAKSGGILSNEMFVIIIWALLYATIIAPIVFKKVLGNYVIKQAAANGENVEAVKETVAEMQRTKTMSIGFTDEIEAEEKKIHQIEHDKLAVMEKENATKDQLIAALKSELADAQGKPLPKLLGVMPPNPDVDAAKKPVQDESADASEQV
jgi:Kef-type K+ transport system membrane component KefB